MYKNDSIAAKFLSLKEVSQIYAIPLNTLRRWASERKFPLYKLSNRIKVSLPEFEEWLEQFHYAPTVRGGDSDEI